MKRYLIGAAVGAAAITALFALTAELHERRQQTRRDQWQQHARADRTHPNYGESQYR